MSFDLRSHRYPSSSSLEQRSEGKAHSSVRSANCSMLPHHLGHLLTSPWRGTEAATESVRSLSAIRAGFFPSVLPTFSSFQRPCTQPPLPLSRSLPPTFHSGGEAVKNVPARKLRSRHSFLSLSRGLARSLSGQRPCSPSQFARPSVDLALS